MVNKDGICIYWFFSTVTCLYNISTIFMSFVYVDFFFKLLIYSCTMVYFNFFKNNWIKNLKYIRNITIIGTSAGA